MDIVLLCPHRTGKFTVFDPFVKDASRTKKMRPLTRVPRVEKRYVAEMTLRVDLNGDAKEFASRCSPCYTLQALACVPTHDNVGCNPNGEM